MNNVENLYPFKRICMTIGNLPTAYIESMSYYECLTYLVNYLTNNVIPTVNNNSEVVKELQDYVNHYFDNLDVQEEINNKLDDMAENGELADIIAQYLQLAGVLAFDSVTDLKNAENLVNGSTAKTLGYYSKNDGGSGLYKIRTITNDDIVDEATIIALHDDSLIAELIVDDVIILEQFGVYGDGTHNDTTNLQKAINYCIANNKTLTSAGKTYLINASLDLNDRIDIDFNNGTIITNSSISMLKFNNNTRNNQGVIKNLVIDMNNVASYGIYGTNLHKKVFDNIVIKNVSNVAYHLEDGFEVIFQNSHFFGTSNTSIGLECGASDCVYKDIVMIDIHTAIKGGAGHNFTRVHSWIWTQSILEGSKFAHITGSGTLMFDNCYSDTSQYGFFIEQNCWAKIQLNQHRHFWNYNLFDGDVIGAFSDPYIYFVYYNGTDGYNLSRQFKITASDLRGFETDQNLAKLCNLNTLERQLCIDDHTVLSNFADGDRVIRSTITTLASDKVSIAETQNILSYFMGTTNITLKMDVVTRLDALNTVTVYQIPERYRPINIKYFSIPYSEDSTLKIDGHCLCIVETNGDVKLRPTSNIPVDSRLYMNISFIPYRNV